MNNGRLLSKRAGWVWSATSRDVLLLLDVVRSLLCAWNTDNFHACGKHGLSLSRPLARNKLGHLSWRWKLSQQLFIWHPEKQKCEWLALSAHCFPVTVTHSQSPTLLKGSAGYPRHIRRTGHAWRFLILCKLLPSNALGGDIGLAGETHVEIVGNQILELDWNCHIKWGLGFHFSRHVYVQSRKSHSYFVGYS